jgi:hypothetical protein
LSSEEEEAAEQHHHAQHPASICIYVYMNVHGYV